MAVAGAEAVEVIRARGRARARATVTVSTTTTIIFLLDAEPAGSAHSGPIVSALAPAVQKTSIGEIMLPVAALI